MRLYWCTVVACIMVFPTLIGSRDACRDACNNSCQAGDIMDDCDFNLCHLTHKNMTISDEIEAVFGDPPFDAIDVDIELGCSFLAPKEGNMTVAIISYMQQDIVKAEAKRGTELWLEVWPSDTVHILANNTGVIDRDEVIDTKHTLLSTKRTPGIFYTCLCTHVHYNYTFDTFDGQTKLVALGVEVYPSNLTSRYGGHYQNPTVQPCDVLDCSAGANEDNKDCWTNISTGQTLKQMYNRNKLTANLLSKTKSPAKDKISFQLWLNGNRANNNSKHLLIDVGNNTIELKSEITVRIGKVELHAIDCSLYAWKRSEGIQHHERTQLETDSKSDQDRYLISDFPSHKFHFSALKTGNGARYKTLVGCYVNYTLTHYDHNNKTEIHGFTALQFYVQPLPKLQVEAQYSASDRSLAGCKNINASFHWTKFDDGHNNCQCILRLSLCNPSKTTHKIKQQVDCVGPIITTVPTTVETVDQKVLVIIMSVMAILLFTTGIAVALVFNRRKKKRMEVRVLTLIEQEPEAKSNSAPEDHTNFFDTEPSGDLTSTDKRKSDSSEKEDTNKATNEATNEATNTAPKTATIEVPIEATDASENHQ